MIQKELLLKELQTKLHNTEDDQIKIVLNELIYNIADGKYNVKVWE
jgi:hypothetical protein